MKIIKNYSLIISIALFQFGCGVVTNTLYIQKADLESDFNSPPLNITNNKTAGSITISPSVSFNSQKKISGTVMEHTRVNNLNVFQVDTLKSENEISYKNSAKNQSLYKGENMEWNIPETSFGLNVDLALSDRVALTVGANTYFLKDRSSISGHAGFGYFKGDEKSGVRLEGGILWREIFYNIHSVLVTTYQSFWGDQSSIVTLSHDRSSKTCIDYYATLTFNSNSKSFVDIFLSLGFFSQSLLDFPHLNLDEQYYVVGSYINHETGESETTAKILFANPGITINLNEMSRVNIGAKMNLINGINSISRNFILTPMVQFDMIF